MQDLLDGDIDRDVANRLLFVVLDKRLRNGPPQLSSDDSESPEPDPELDIKLQEVLATSQDGEVHVYGSTDDALVDKLEGLLPSLEEDEDAHKSNWDTVMEIHGRELVKANEMNPTCEWKIACLVARLLVHFDFITQGVASTSP